MTVTLDWTILVGSSASPADMTSRCTGLQVAQRVTIMAPSTHTATVTLLNNDGALTPAASGGTGTYASVDWLACGVWISCDANSDTAEVFHGLVSDFVLDDDGINSTVTITAVDPLSIAGRGPAEFPGSLPGTTTIAAGIETVLEQMLDYTTATLPLIGATFADQKVVHVTDATFGPTIDLAIGLTVDNLRIADMLRNQVMASDISAVWGGRIVSVGSSTIYYAIIVGPGLQRITVGGGQAWATAQHFTFDPTPASGELPIGKLEVGYNDRRRINWTNLTSLEVGTTTTEHINTASVQAYGAQNYTAIQTLHYSNADLAASAGNIANRFADYTWTPNRLQFTSAHLADLDAGSSDELAALLDAAGLWQTATINWTPTGGSATSAEVLITGRTIRATPANTTVTLTFDSAIDLQPFILNDSTYGVLDTNRLG